ncbi:phage tail protein [Sphingomonas sp.]|uniref:phage tail protein n=1 Tax=Sphingomonas sp. TaxID=28214 RepID=UPI003B3AF612
MADPFYGEIRIFTYTFTPQDWVQCNGQQLSIQQYQVLYAVIGNQFGGDLVNYFNVPNLQGSAIYGAGNGAGLTPRVFGKSTGTSSVTLDDAAQLPRHQHNVTYYGPANADLTNAPTPTAHLARTIGQNDFTNTDVSDTTLAYQMIGAAGGNASGISLPHENRQPYLALNFCMCAYGEFPLRP